MRKEHVQKRKKKLIHPLNRYAMRAREWYGWHFPEMAKILNDNETFCRVVLKMGDRTKCVSTDFTGIMEVVFCLIFLCKISHQNVFFFFVFGRRTLLLL